jgi:HEPN domain-containing protein
MSDVADRWLAFAYEDLRVAEIALEEGIYNQVCFHAQQCVEKALKSALAREGRVPPRVHSITDLLRLLPAEWFVTRQDDIVGLDDYYIPTRYPDALPGTLPEGLPGRSEAEEALSLARLVLERVGHSV